MDKASETTTDPLGKNIPTMDMGGFRWGVTDDVDDPPADLGVLGLLENKTFKGPGYNCIFRPRSNKPLPKETVINTGSQDDNDLQLNLTVETLSFSGAIGSIPNRGLSEQSDIVLAGLTYMDSVQDVTNPDTGKGDLETSKSKGIHSEPGVWLAIPSTPEDTNASPSFKSPFPKATLCRMASIPHGVTINAQGLQPSLKPVRGSPKFEEANINPFTVDEDGNVTRLGGSSPFFDNLRFGATTNRTPQDLKTFGEAGTITPEILANPNLVLDQAIANQKILNYITFDISTDSTAEIDGGGTANIDFLGPRPTVTKSEALDDRKQDAPPGSSAPRKLELKKNAFVPSMKATYWIETVEYKFMADGGKSSETLYRPAGDFGPTFRVPPTLGRSGKTPFTVYYTQLQYSQTVILDFANLLWPHMSVATLGEQTTFNLVLPPETSTPPPEDIQGKWGPVFDLQNVAAHASLLPTGKVLYWGRRADWKSADPDTMSEHFTNTFLWDPSTGISKATAKHPTLQNHPDKGTNLFCSGHCFQPDGSLFVAGGHLQDFHGSNQVSIYNPFEDTWTAQDRMNYGRWYPSALTLNDGSIFVMAGSFYDDTYDEAPQNAIPQIWRDNHWVNVPRAPMLSSYPRLHLEPGGRVFVAGTQATAEFLDENAKEGPTWTQGGPNRHGGNREYGPSVMYDNGKIMYIGGGGPPTNVVEFIDFTDKKKTPAWKIGPRMKHKRRHHNGTVLPDGTVLVTGGTKGREFNDVSNAVHTPELYDTFAKPPHWTEMADEAVDRCYHSIALLLPDGRVLSAGGGEWAPDDVHPNDPSDSHADGQLFYPPYLFKGVRPTIQNAPLEIGFDERFEVMIGVNDLIAKVSWIRLGSATHACNMSQSLTFLAFEQQRAKVIITTPAAGEVPPGHYMLFLVSRDGVPSIAPIIRIRATGPISINPERPESHFVFRTVKQKDHTLNLPSLNEKIASQEGREPVAVGLTSDCPYGLGPCWGGAFEALQRIKDIDVVRPVPDHNNSIGFVYLHQDILPDIDVWRREFGKVAHQSYDMRGIDMTLSGVVKKAYTASGEPPQLIMTATPTRSEVVLTPFQQSSNLKWDRLVKAPKPITEAETHAFTRLVNATPDSTQGMTVKVTGRLHKNGDKFSLHIRDFKESDKASGANLDVPNGV